MANRRKSIFESLHGVLLGLYPRSFRLRFGESMKQTFADLCRYERRSTVSMLGMIANIAAGVVTENLYRLRGKIFMTDRMLDPTRAAIASVILFLPFFLIAAIFVFEVEPLLGIIKSGLTVDGQQLSGFGRIVIFGSVLLLPMALLVNLFSMVRNRAAAGATAFRVRPFNAAIGLAVVCSIVVIAGWMITESMRCSAGTCD